MYPNVNLYIDGAWKPAASGKTLAVLNPATAEPIGTVAHAEKADLDAALAAAQKGFAIWRKVPPHERYRLMRKAADILRGRAGEIATLMTMEQGKPLVEVEGRDARRRRRHRLVRRGSAPRLWAYDSAARRRHLAARGEGAGRPGRRVHPVEFPDQPGGPQDVRARSPPAARSSSKVRKRRRLPALPSSMPMSRPGSRRASSTSCSGCRRRFRPTSFRIR